MKKLRPYITTGGTGDDCWAVYAHDKREAAGLVRQFIKERGVETGIVEATLATPVEFQFHSENFRLAKESGFPNQIEDWERSAWSNIPIENWAIELAKREGASLEFEESQDEFMIPRGYPPVRRVEFPGGHT